MVAELLQGVMTVPMLVAPWVLRHLNPDLRRPDDNSFRLCKISLRLHVDAATASLDVTVPTAENETGTKQLMSNMKD